MVRFLIQALMVVVVFIAAWRKGGRPERYVATIYFSMLLASSLQAFHSPPADPYDFDEIHLFRAWLDVAALVGVVFVALRYDRWWTLWVGSVQFLAVMAHVLKALDMPVAVEAYAVMERWPVWMAVFLAGLGTYLYNQRSKTLITDT